MLYIQTTHTTPHTYHTNNNPFPSLPLLSSPPPSPQKQNAKRPKNQNKNKRYALVSFEAFSLSLSLFPLRKKNHQPNHNNHTILPPPLLSSVCINNSSSSSFSSSPLSPIPIPPSTIFYLATPMLLFLLLLFVCSITSFLPSFFLSAEKMEKRKEAMICSQKIERERGGGCVYVCHRLYKTRLCTTTTNIFFFPVILFPLCPLCPPLPLPFS